MEITWQCKDFKSLSTYEIYAILQLRINVFMLEQQCLYPECDDKDLNAHHLFALHGNRIVAYARLLPPGISYVDASIGRVVTAADHRNAGLGKLVMQYAISNLDILFPQNEIRISAQAHLQKFYESLGFEKVSDTYLEDNIPHIEMLLSRNKNRRL